MKLSVFFDQACTISLLILILFIPVSSALIESFFWVSLLLFLGRIFTSGDLLSRLLKREKIVLIFFGALALSLINSGNYLGISVHALFLKWGEYIALYLMITQTMDTSSKVKYALTSITIGGGIVILDCFSQVFLNLEFLRHRHMVLQANKVLVLTGPFKNNNDFAAYLTCLLIIILYWIFSKGSKAIKLAAVSILFLGIFILVHAYSRGGWVSFILAIILLAFFMRKFWFLGFAFVITLTLGLKGNLHKCLLFKDSGRIELWDICLRMIKQHPFLGNGIGTFMAWFRTYSTTRGISYAHNCYLQLWAEAGVFSLAIFVFFIFNTLKEGILSYEINKGPIFLILSCAAIAFLCHSAVDTFFFSYQLFTLFWVILGLLKASLITQVKEA